MSQLGVTDKQKLRTLQQALTLRHLKHDRISKSLVELGWRPGFLVYLPFTSKRLDPLRDDYNVAPSGRHALVQIR